MQKKPTKTQKEQKIQKEKKHRKGKKRKNKYYKKCTFSPAISTSYLFHFLKSNKIKLGRGLRDFRPCYYLK